MPNDETTSQSDILTPNNPMPNKPLTSYHMSSAEFRAAGHALIDWIAEYYEQVEQYPVLSQVEPGEVRRQLPPSPPAYGESFDAMMADVDRIIMPGITHWQSPNFFAFFPANTSGPAILGDLLSSGLGVQGMIWATSPACTELETHVLDWVAEMLDLPRAVPLHLDGRRLDPGFGEQRGSGRFDRGARACHRLCDQCARR